jgi:hypothetical protein
MTEDDRGLREAIRRLEEHLRYGEPSGGDLPSHAASDEGKFAEINQRLDDLESMIMNVMQKTGMFNKPGGPP